VAILVTDGERYQLYRSQTGRIERGPVKAELLYEVAGVPLRPQQLVALLLGAPLLPPGAQAADAEVGPAGSLRLHWLGASLAFDPEGRLRSYTEHPGDSGKVQVEVHYDEYDEQAFARRVDLVFPAVGLRAVVEFREVELNPQLPLALFRLQAAERGGASSRGAPQ